MDQPLACTCKRRFVVGPDLIISNVAESPHELDCPVDDAMIVHNVRVPLPIKEKWQYLRRNPYDWQTTNHTADLHDAFRFMTPLGEAIRLRRACYALHRVMLERALPTLERYSDLFITHKLYSINLDADTVTVGYEKPTYDALRSGLRYLHAARTLHWKTLGVYPLDDPSLWPRFDGHYLMPKVLAEHMGGVETLVDNSKEYKRYLFKEAAHLLSERPWLLPFEEIPEYEQEWAKETDVDLTSAAELVTMIMADVGQSPDYDVPVDAMAFD